MNKLILVFGAVFVTLLLLGCTQKVAFEKTSAYTNTENGAKVTTEYYESEGCGFGLRIAEYDTDQDVTEVLNYLKQYLMTSGVGGLMTSDVGGYQLLEGTLQHAPYADTSQYYWVSGRNVITATQPDWHPPSEFTTPSGCTDEKSDKLFNEFTLETLKKYPCTQS